MKSLKDRLKEVRKKAQLTQEELSSISGIPQQKISRIENGITEMPRDIAVLAKYLNTTPGYLMFGEKHDTLSACASASHLVPLISWATAGKWRRSNCLTLLQDNCIEKIECFRKMHSSAFALKVKGDAMLSMEGMAFPANTILVVDPEKSVRSHDYVIAAMAKGEAMFRQYIVDGGKKYLKPLNSRYPIIEITSQTTICGVVVATQCSL